MIDLLITKVLILTLRTIQWFDHQLKIHRKTDIQLRDARTGQFIGLTQKQHKQYVDDLRSNNPDRIIRAYREVKLRSDKLNSSLKN